MSVTAHVVDNVGSLSGVINTQEHIGATIGEGKAKLVGILGIGNFGAKKYKGPYEATPQSVNQVFETKSKTMKENFTVNPIPYYATGNEVGGITIYIGE